MKTLFGVKGILELLVLDKNRVAIRHEKVENLVVQWGIDQVIYFLTAGNANQPYTHIALGDSAVTPTMSDTALGNELIRGLADISVSDPITARAYIEWDIGTAVGSYQEAGLFNAATDGNMFSRVVFPELIVDSSNYLIAMWDIIVSSRGV